MTSLVNSLNPEIGGLGSSLKARERALVDIVIFAVDENAGLQSISAGGSGRDEHPLLVGSNGLSLGNQLTRHDATPNANRNQRPGREAVPC